MEEPSDSIVEARKELMVSSSGESPTRRTARFIRPTTGHDNETFPNRKSQSLSPASFDPKSWPLKVKFHGWRHPQKNWESWVGKMASLHEPTWKQAGIHEAVLNSRYRIIRNDDVVLGLAEKWCNETKSFILPWGEATITLEDVIVLGGYSVLGSPVFTPLETQKLKEIELKLDIARKEINKTRAKKADQFKWMEKFMNSGSEIEHEAFITLWLSRFVFASSLDVIVRRVFPIAIHLARGNRIALAPTVLAHIYRDLTILKENIVAASKLKRHENDKDEEFLEVTLWSPFQLVQVWGWERISELGPKPNLIENGEPRLAQWHDLRCRVGNLRNVLASAKASFDWRPYARALTNWDVPKFYVEKEIWVLVDSLKDELLSFARCVRVSQLVGLGCVVQYLPNRVALQFGMDQDIPGNVPRLNRDPQIAWDDYVQIGNGEMYIPPRLFEGDVTTRYLDWWRRSMSKSSEELAKNFKGEKQMDNVGPQSRKFEASRLSMKRKHGDNGSVPDVCPPKRLKESAMCSKAGQNLTNVNVSPINLMKASKDPVVRSGENDKYQELIHTGFLTKVKELNDSPFPPGFPPKCSRLDAKVTPEDDEMISAELLKSERMHEIIKNRKLADSSKIDLNQVTEKVIIIDDDDDDVAGCEEGKAAENFSSPSESPLSSFSWNKCLMNLEQPTLQNEAASEQPEIIRTEDAIGSVIENNTEKMMDITAHKFYEVENIGDEVCYTGVFTINQLNASETEELDDCPGPPGFSPKYNSLEAKVTIEDDKTTIEELLKSNEKFTDSSKKDETKVTEKVIYVDDDDFVACKEGNAGENFSSSSPSLSSSLSCNGCSVNLKQPNVLLGEELMQNEAAGGQAEIIRTEDAIGSVMGNNMNEMMDSNAHKLYKEGNIRDEEVGCSFTIDLPKLEIEDRIITLERLVAKIKAATFGQKVR